MGCRPRTKNPGLVAIQYCVRCCIKEIDEYPSAFLFGAGNSPHGNAFVCKFAGPKARKKRKKGFCMEKKNKLTVKTVAYVGVLAAMYLILSYISVGTNDFKASSESFVVVIAGMLLGPATGFAVGAVGEFIHQILLYGLELITPLWMLPYALDGLVCGLIAGGREDASPKRIRLAIIAGELTLTIAVTLVNWATAVYQGWGNWVVIAAGIPLRLAITAVRIAIYCAITPELYKRMKRLV